MRLIKEIFSIFLLVLLFFFSADAKKKEKPKLLVYGAGVEAFAAALQGAKSNVSTLWIMKEDEILPDIPQDRFSVQGNDHLDGGIWMDLLMALGKTEEKSDSIARLEKQNINPRLVRNILEEWIDNQPLLHVITGVDIETLERKRNSWEVRLSDKQTYKVKSVVDADAAQKIAKPFLGDRAYSAFLNPKELSKEEFRTILGNGERGGEAYSILFKNLEEAEKEGVYGLGFLAEENRSDVEGIPLRMAYGQALGALASYTAFFNTTIDKVELRLLQEELLSFDARLMPFRDVPAEDPNFSALQRFALSGIVLGVEDSGLYILDRKKEVNQDEVRQVLDQMHARSKLWFLDNSVDIFTWEEALNYIGFVSFRGQELQKEVEKYFQQNFPSEEEFDKKQRISRYAFGTILSVYENPFRIKIDQKGNLLR